MKIIAEIGINHNGDLSIVKKLIDIAVFSGCTHVKFQKRTPDICVPEKKKKVKRDTPWGKMTYLDYKRYLEFDQREYEIINDYCRGRIKWFASVWDLPSAEFMSHFCKIVKIPSACLTDHELGRCCRDNFETVILSTGMSTEEEIEKSVVNCDPNVIMHTNSAYPSPVNELHLRYITLLKRKYVHKVIGYSGHEYGLVPTFAAFTMGAKWIERHITLDRFMWGSDQMCSVEPGGLIKLCKGLRDIEEAIGGYGMRTVRKSELKKKEMLRK